MLDFPSSSSNFDFATQQLEFSISTGQDEIQSKVPTPPHTGKESLVLSQNILKQSEFFCPSLFGQHGGDGDGVGGLPPVEHGLESVRDGDEVVGEALPEAEVCQPDLAGHPGGGGHRHALLQQRLRQRLQGLAVQQAWKIL